MRLRTVKQKVGRKVHAKVTRLVCAHCGPTEPQNAAVYASVHIPLSQESLLKVNRPAFAGCACALWSPRGRRETGVGRMRGPAPPALAGCRFGGWSERSGRRGVEASGVESHPCFPLFFTYSGDRWFLCRGRTLTLCPGNYSDSNIACLPKQLCIECPTHYSRIFTTQSYQVGVLCRGEPERV